MRDCDLIPHTTDLDLIALAEDLNEDFLASFKKLDSSRIRHASTFGSVDSHFFRGGCFQVFYGMELRYHLFVEGSSKAVQADVFIAYPHNSTHRFASYWASEFHRQATFPRAVFKRNSPKLRTVSRCSSPLSLLHSVQLSASSREQLWSEMERVHGWRRSTVSSCRESDSFQR